jgi:hypothetical protein
MNINLKTDFKLSDQEKYYIINIVLSTFEVPRKRAKFIELASAIKSTGKQAVEDLIKLTADYASKNSKHNINQVIVAILPSIEYFFNEVQLEIRHKSYDITILK